MGSIYVRNERFLEEEYSVLVDGDAVRRVVVADPTVGYVLLAEEHWQTGEPVVDLESPYGFRTFRREGVVTVTPLEEQGYAIPIKIGEQTRYLRFHQYSLPIPVGDALLQGERMQLAVGDSSPLPGVQCLEMDPLNLDGVAGDVWGDAYRKRLLGEWPEEDDPIVVHLQVNVETDAISQVANHLKKHLLFGKKRFR